MIQKVLVTCPPMLGMIDEFRPHFARMASRGWPR